MNDEHKNGVSGSVLLSGRIGPRALKLIFVGSVALAGGGGLALRGSSNADQALAECQRSEHVLAAELDKAQQVLALPSVKRAAVQAGYRDFQYATDLLGE